MSAAQVDLQERLVGLENRLAPRGSLEGGMEGFGQGCATAHTWISHGKLWPSAHVAHDQDLSGHGNRRGRHETTKLINRLGTNTTLRIVLPARLDCTFSS